MLAHLGAEARDFLFLGGEGEPWLCSDKWRPCPWPLANPSFLEVNNKNKQDVNISKPKYLPAQL